jgi:hypothetical protein
LWWKDRCLNTWMMWHLWEQIDWQQIEWIAMCQTKTWCGWGSSGECIYHNKATCHSWESYQGILGQFWTTEEWKENNQWVSHTKLFPLYVSVKWESLQNLGPPVCSTWVMVLDYSRYVELLVSIWS